MRLSTITSKPPQRILTMTDLKKAEKKQWVPPMNWEELVMFLMSQSLFIKMLFT